MNPSKILVFVLVIPLALFLILEAALWLLFPSPLLPSIRLKLSNSFSDHGLENTVTIVQHATGLRPANWLEQPSGRRILALGGEDTGSLLQEDSDTWWGQLERQLEAAELGEVSVGAFGGGALSNASRWLVSQEDLGELDLLIVLAGSDEFLGRGAEYRYEAGLASRKTPPIRPKNALMKSVVGYSQLARKLWHGRLLQGQEQRQRELGQDDYFKKRFQAQRNVYGQIGGSIGALPVKEGENPVKEFEEALAVIVKWAGARGVPVLFVSEPSPHSAVVPFALSQRFRQFAFLEMAAEGKEGTVVKVDPAVIAQGISELTRRAQALLAGAANGKVSDLAAEFPIEKDHFFDDIYFSDLGSQKVASELVPVVAEMLSR